jgi:heme oxygenase
MRQYTVGLTELTKILNCKRGSGKKMRWCRRRHNGNAIATFCVYIIIIIITTLQVRDYKALAAMMKVSTSLLLWWGVLSALALAPTASFAFQQVAPLRSTRSTHSIIMSATSTKEEDSAVLITDKEEDINPRLQGLALQLDDGTRKSHSMAQNSAFVTGFFKGLSTRKAYRSLITSYYFVYQAMERSFDEISDTDVKALDDTELRRLPALEKDMDYFYGPNWKNEITMSAGTKTYVDRVNQLASSDKDRYLLVAHQYTRYLGDLFGGQMMSGMAQRSLDLQDDKGVDFYNFQGISSVKDFITDWYTRLNALELSEEQKELIVDEANFVFDLNIGILEEIDGNPLKAMWTLAINSLQIQLGLKK